MALSAVMTGCEGPAASDAWVSLAWSAAITVAFIATALTLYQRAAAQ